ncbi:MAG: DUF935 family protein [Melioribacteraceae bacterium]|nr:DUF935 family protein [Melioribacteraceae bacterium]
MPDPDKILEENYYDYSIYRDLLTDPHLSAALQQRKMQVLQMGIELIGDKKQKQRAKTVLERLRIQKIVSDALNAVLYGFVPLEVNYEYDGGELKITDVNEKPQEWFFFDQNNELYLRKRVDGLYYYEKGRKLPDYKFIIVRNEPTYSNPYGKKVLSSAYWPVTFKRAAIEDWQDRVQRFGLPFIEGEYPTTATPTEIAEFEAKLEEMLDTNVLTKMAGYELTFKEPVNYTLDEVYHIIIRFHNTEISKAILSETLTIEIDRAGSYKAADIHREMLGLIGLSDKKLAELTIDRLLQYDMYLNFGKLEAAKVKLRTAEDIREVDSTVEIMGR